MGKVMSLEEQERHLNVIKNFLEQINEQKNNPLVLKGGTALSMCYDLNRLSVDLDFDGLHDKNSFFFNNVGRFCKEYGHTFNVKKNTNFGKRVTIDYGNTGNPLKVEVASKNKDLPTEEIVCVNGIQTYTLNELARQKANAYSHRDRIRDLWDVCYLSTYRLDDLDKTAQRALKDALAQKSFSQFDYIVETQADDDPLIDVGILADMFLDAFNNFHLLVQETEEETDLSEFSDVIKPDVDDSDLFLE